MTDNKDIRAALGEPVAWRYKFKPTFAHMSSGSNRWVLANQDPKASRVTAWRDLRIIEALYPESTILSLAARIEELEKRLAHQEHVIDRDRYIVAAGISAIETACRGRQWTLEGRGPYEWDDDQYREEFGQWLDDVIAALSPLRKVAWDKSDCTNIEARVCDAKRAANEILKQPLGPREMIAADLGIHDKRDAEITVLKNRIEELERENARLRKHPWCETCGKDVPEVLCQTCTKWWAEQEIDQARAALNRADAIERGEHRNT